MAVSQASHGTRSWFTYIVLALLFAVVLLASLFVIWWMTTTEAELFARRLRNVARDGCLESTITTIVGEPDSRLKANQAPQWLIESLKRRKATAGLEESDEFLVYKRRHGKSGSIETYLQVRGNRLINVDPTDFEEPDVSFNNIHTLR